MDLAWLTLLALLVVVGISCTSRLNPGVAAIALAWLIVRWATPHFGSSLNEKALWSGFPAELFLTLLGVSWLFAQAEGNGTLRQAATAIEGLCHGRRGMLPILFFIIALNLGSFGPGNIAVAGLIAPMAMAAAKRTGISPLLMAVMVGHGAIGSTVSPFTAAGVVANQKLVEIGLSDVAWKVFAWNAAANCLAAAGGFTLLGGWRLWRKSTATVTAIDSQLSVRFEGRHWLTMGVIGLMIAAVVILKTQIGMTAFMCAAVLSLLRAADEGETLRRIPWSVLVMVCGVSVLTSLLEKTGGNERFAQLIAKVSSPATLPAFVAFVTGIVSIYSSTTGVVLPVFLPLVKDIAASHSLSNPLGLALAVLVGGNLVDMSPLSTIGAICLAASPVDCDRRLLFNQLLAWGFAMAVVGALVSWVCF